MNKKTTTLLLTFAVIIIVALVVQVKMGDRKAEESVLEEPTEAVTKRPPFALPREEPEGFKEYRNVFHRFQLLYPDHMEVSEEKIAAGTTLITFTSATDDKSFQIFIVPHGEQEITDHRLRADLPSGVMNNQQEIIIDGTKATVFESETEGIGSTRELWFINRGFLYEVTTSLENDAWLSEIMTDWMFL